MPTAPTVDLDPELAVALSALPRGANGSLMDLTDIPALRAALASATDLMPVPPLDPNVGKDVRQVRRPDGTTLDVLLFRPIEKGSVLPVLVWFHAGGQVVGSAHDDEAYHGALAVALHCVVAAVDYRLAPETPAPGAAEDGHLAVGHLIAHAAALDIDPDRLGLAGASGGGAIAAATALMLRDRGGSRPCLLSLSYAMLDDRNQTPSSHQIVDVGVWDRRENQLAWAAVLGDRAGSADVDPHSAPGRATHLEGLPPTFIAVAQHDVLRDEDIDFASGLMAAGVPVELHVYPGAFHAFDRFAPTSGLTRRFESTWHDSLRRLLYAPTSDEVR